MTSITEILDVARKLCNAADVNFLVDLEDGKGSTIRGYGSEGMDAARFKHDNESVQQELESRGLKPTDDAGISWMIKDPDGFPVQVAPEAITASRIGMSASIRRGARPARTTLARAAPALLGFVATLVMGSASARTSTKPELVATIPHPGFLENLTERSDGSIYITAAFDRIIWKVGRDRQVEQLTTLPRYTAILGIAPLADGFVVAAFRRSFGTPAGVDFSDVGSVLLLLDRYGKVRGSVTGPRGSAFNGLVADGRGKYLIADSHLPVIWQFDPVSRTISEWLRDEAALGVPSARDVGGDGLKVAGNAVYVSNKTRLSVYKVERAADGRPQGALTLVAAHLPTGDDFAVAADGTVYVPAPEKSQPNENTPLTKVAPNGQVSAFISDAPYSASAIISRDGHWLYWATSVNDGLVNHQQQLLRAPIR